MARTSSSVLLLLVLYITCTTILASRHITVKLSCNNDTSFVETSCKSTTYPTVCVQYLLPYASKIQRSPKKVALVALSRSVVNVHSCQNRKKTQELEANRVWSNCRLLSRFEWFWGIKNSIQELEHLGQCCNMGQCCLHQWRHRSWWFSNKDMDGKVKDSIRAKVVTVDKITSNALALVEKFAKTHWEIAQVSESVIHLINI